MTKRLPPIDIEQVRRMVRNGSTFVAIAHYLNVGEGRIMRLAAANGLASAIYSRPPLPLDQIRANAARGLYDRESAKLIGNINHQKIRRARLAHGIAIIRSDEPSPPKVDRLAAELTRLYAGQKYQDVRLRSEGAGKIAPAAEWVREI